MQIKRNVKTEMPDLKIVFKAVTHGAQSIVYAIDESRRF